MRFIWHTVLIYRYIYGNKHYTDDWKTCVIAREEVKVGARGDFKQEKPAMQQNHQTSQGNVGFEKKHLSNLNHPLVDVLKD